jgi:subtilisin family serine protease
VALAALPLVALPAHAAADDTPTDPVVAQQWAMQPGAPLDAPAAWRYTQGSGAVVAVLDTGADLSHQDLQGALWTNPKEIPGNGVDDDHDGFVDDVHGADFMGNDGDPSDENGHGTHVAGLIAAQLNGKGSVGLAPGARLMIVRVLDASMRGTTDVVAKGIRYAVAHGADIINTSINGDADDPDLDKAIDVANAAGVTIVASAGNNSRDLDLRPSWPASSKDPNVISVAATGQDSLLAAFSNWGGRSVDLAAPGVDIVSTSSTGGYEARSGTSMAAPEVAATMALLRSAAPSAGPDQLRQALLGTTTHPKGLLGKLMTGEVDPVAALQAVAPQASSSATALTARVKRRAKHSRRTLVTWSAHGRTDDVVTFRVSGAGGKTLAVRRATSRGAWIRRTKGRVRIAARDADRHTISAVTISITKHKGRAARARR